MHFSFEIPINSKEKFHTKKPVLCCCEWWTWKQNSNASIRDVQRRKQFRYKTSNETLSVHDKFYLTFKKRCTKKG